MKDLTWPPGFAPGASIFSHRTTKTHFNEKRVLSSNSFLKRAARILFSFLMSSLLFSNNSLCNQYFLLLELMIIKWFCDKSNSNPAISDHSRRSVQPLHWPKCLLRIHHTDFIIVYFRIQYTFFYKNT